MRRRATRRTLQGVLLFLFALLSLSCRDTLPVNGTPVAPVSRGFLPGDYFTYDNWQLDAYGDEIPGSYFRNSWTVADTGRFVQGRSRVTIVVDSTFTGANQFVRKDSLLFQFDVRGDVYQYGFLASLIAARETLHLAPQWERIAAFSLATGTAWVVALLDAGVGLPESETVSGTIAGTREYVGITINGVFQQILSSRIEITKPQLDYTFWFLDSPTAVVRVVDNSEALSNATFRQLVSTKRR